MSRTAALRERVRTSLASVLDPEIRQPITELDMVDAIDVEVDAATGNPASVAVTVLLTVAGCPAARAIEREVREAIAAALSPADGGKPVPWHLEMGVMTPEQRARLTARLRGSRPSGHPFGPDSLTRVIAVTSGKGGVGKSTVTANLAVALARHGLAVGIVDADVHGFSIPGLMGLRDEPSGGAAAVSATQTGSNRPTRVGDLIMPPVAHGVKVISIGMFLDESSGDGIVAWRGPMLHRTLEQFLRDVHFGALDVLLLDLPPGTGDIAISLGQLLPNAEVVVVTTPQRSAAEVAWRSGLLARKAGQRVVGVIETMSAMSLPSGERVAIFGEGGGRAVANRLSTAGEQVPLLAEVPVSEALRADGDAGSPHVLAHPDSPAASALRAAADSLLTLGATRLGRRLPIHSG